MLCSARPFFAGIALQTARGRIDGLCTSLQPVPAACKRALGLQGKLRPPLERRGTCRPPRPARLMCIACALFYNSPFAAATSPAQVSNKQAE